MGLFLACLVAAGAACAQDSAPTVESLITLNAMQRENTLAAIRNSRNADATLLALSTQAATRAEARRQSGQPPLFAGCLRGDEFELGAQLGLARASYDSKAYRALAAEYRRLTTALRTALSSARSSGNWRKRFSHLGHWISDWERAKDPATRELLERTLVDQGIRASLSAFDGAKIYGKTRAAAALRAYDEYLFNLMCTADEDNLRWLRGQVARNGWFDISRYGAAADQAAWLMVQHADGDHAYQAYIVSVLAPKATTHETNPQNFAFLSDHVAVRSGEPQTYATQMECVDGEWLAPQVDSPENLDARRASVGLPPYRVQVSQRRNLHCAQKSR
jgi:hypothetical protein